MGDRGEKLELRGKWVKKIQPFENLIKFCILNFQLSSPSAYQQLGPMASESCSLWGNEHLEIN